MWPLFFINFEKTITMKITGNEPAYPVVGDSGFCTALGNIGKDDCAGMTIRTEFAARAMQGIYSGCLGDVDVFNAMNRGAEENGCKSIAEWIARQAIVVADALIEELNKEKP